MMHTLPKELEAMENGSMPLVSIAIPTYNREDLVRGAIESALASHRTDIEILVIDNCSEDRTVEVARSYEDNRVRVIINDSNLGLFGNFNRCIELSQGKYVCILCSDDRITPEFLDKAIAAMEANPDCGLLTTHAEFVDLNGNVVGTTADHLRKGVYQGNDAIINFCWFHAHYAFNVFNYPSGMLIRKSVLGDMPLFPTRMRIVGDCEFFTRVLEKSNLCVLEMVGCRETKHEGQEVYKIYDRPDRVYEHYEILERYEGKLGKLFSSCLAGEGAVNTALAIKFWRLGMKPTAKAHWDIVQSKRVGPFRQVWAFLKLVFYRLLYKLAKTRFMPRGPVRSVNP